MQTSSDDNGAHIEIDGVNVGPVQACQQQDVWAFTAGRRTQTDHCGEFHVIDVHLTAGEHTLVVRPRDADFKLDAWGAGLLE